ncbi:MAG TPA: hypothetical protein VM869_35815 [Enhygromyxa sp.]|nr:hypothetical protein [Enhygromyxa sp.]
MAKTINRCAAEALALEDFSELSEAQKLAILDALDVGTNPRIKSTTGSKTRRALERLELVQPGTRDFTPWGLFIYRTAKARSDQARRELAAKASARRGNRRQAQLFEAA